MKKSAVAGDVMSRKVRTVRDDCPMEQLVDLIRETHFSGFPVVNADGRPVGLVSQTDVLRGLAAVIDPEFAAPFLEGGSKLTSIAEDGVRASAVLLGLMIRPVKEFMTPKVETCRPDTPLAKVCATMSRRRIHRVVVVEKNQVVGMISALDIVRWTGKALA